MRQRLATIVGPVLGVALLTLAVAILHRELAIYHLDDLSGHLRGIPARRSLLAVLLTGLGYWTLTGYDALAFHYIRNPLPYRRIALTSFVAYVFSHNVGLSFFGGSAVRYRMHSSWGVRADEIARIIAFALLTFWMGFFLLGGVVHTVWPSPVDLPGLHLASSRPIGLGLGAVLLVYLTLRRVRRAPLVVHGFQIDLPDARTTAAQLVVSALDWLLAAAVLYVLLPPGSGLPFTAFLGAYLLAQVIGLVSHVPGGLGVFESAMVLLLRGRLPADQLLASMVAYRIVYYLLPMLAAVVLFAAYELGQRGTRLARAQAEVRGWMTAVIPRLLATTTFLAGAMMVWSGATPELPGRLAWLRETLPVPVLEISKLLGSIFGVVLVVLANALRLRIDAAYPASLALLLGGAVVSLLKGLAWEEAAILAGMALALAPCRAFFDRKSSLLSQPLSPSWWLSVAAVALASLFALELAYRHVEYSHELWWRFGAGVQAPRSLRALLAAGVTLLAVGALRLLRPPPPEPAPPTSQDLDRVQAIVARGPQVEGYLALLGDKQILFDEHRDAFLMYGVSGRTWVAMSDPVGPREAREALGWRFLELADRHGARAVFYEVSEPNLAIYLELGLDLRKLGEEARVPLRDFSLDGPTRKGLRQTDHRMAREGCRFEILSPDSVPPVLDELEAISNLWLARKNTREKRFSLGFFDRAYLSRLPLAVVRRGERIVAFSNVWPSETRQTLSGDLMRYGPDAPPGVMEYLFTQLMLWGREQGYQHYALGMAPLSGFERHRLAPRWNRLGALLFRHGEHFYNFQGLRAFKDKFHPEWEPRYLASPGGLAVPIVLTHVASLVSGGVSGIVSR